MLPRIRIALSFFICLSSLTVWGQIDDPKASFRALRALDGVWFLPSDRGDQLEIWDIVNDTLMTGRGVRIKAEDGDTILLETLRLVRRDTSIIYTAIVKGQNQNKPVDFRLTADDDNGFLFENPKHDNPQKIRYQFSSKSELTVSTEGKRNGRVVTDEMVFEREFNPATIEVRLRAGVGAGALASERKLTGVVVDPAFAWRPNWDLGIGMAFKGSGGFLTMHVEAALAGRSSGVESEFYDDTVRYLRNGTYRTLWAQVAVYPAFTLRRDGRLSVIVGPYYGRLLWADATGTNLPESGRGEAFEPKNDLLKDDFGFLGGLQYRLNTARPITVGLRYNYGLRDLDNLYKRRCNTSNLCNERIVLRGIQAYASVKLR
jgi:Domain of unknown function (DUF6265)/Outer membrane protein beta-barrel domain